MTLTSGRRVTFSDWANAVEANASATSVAATPRSGRARGMDRSHGGGRASRRLGGLRLLLWRRGRRLVDRPRFVFSFRAVRARLVAAGAVAHLRKPRLHQHPRELIEGARFEANRDVLQRDV